MWRHKRRGDMRGMETQRQKRDQQIPSRQRFRDSEPEKLGPVGGRHPSPSGGIKAARD